MSEHALMRKDGAEMNVPPEKVEAYKLEGWTVIARPPEPPPVQQTEDIEPRMKHPAAEEQTPADVDQVVAKVSRRSKKG